jgi:hypothetical protein
VGIARTLAAQPRIILADEFDRRNVRDLVAHATPPQGRVNVAVAKSRL